MIKTLIAAIFLSQALTQEEADELDRYTRRVNTIHVSCLSDCTVVVSLDQWDTPKAPVPYYGYWDNGLNQTAQQFIGITSMLQQELREVEQSILNQELQRLRERIEEKARRRYNP